MLSTSLDELPAGHQDGSAVGRPDCRLGRPLVTAARGSSESHHVSNPTTGPDAGNVRAALPPGRQYKEVEYFTHCVGHCL
jgi:hypothetical protein